MKTMSLLTILIIPFFLVCLFPLEIYGQLTCSEIKSKVDSNYNITLENAKDMKQKILKEKEAIKQKRNEMEQSLTSQKKRLERLRKKYQTQEEEETKISKKIQSEKKTIQSIKDSVYSSAQRTNTIIKTSPITGQYPERIEEIQPLLDKRIFPGMEGVKIIFNTLREEIELSANIAKYHDNIISTTGNEQKAEIGRIGSLCSIYEMDESGNVGYLRIEGRGDEYAVQGKPSWIQLRTIKEYMDGQSQSVPLDVSGGTVFKFLAKKKDFVDWIKAGGILIWPIFALAAFALLIAIERFFYLMWMQSKSNKSLKWVSRLVRREKWGECKKLCEQDKKSPICHMVLSMLNHWGVQQEVMENVIHESLLKFVPKMERLLPTLGILGAIAPLLGLLGTVTGIINTFQIITMFGTGDPKLMSGGISEALVTTQLGLAVAIPIMLIHHYFRRKVDNMVGKIEERGNAFALKMMTGGAVQGEEQDVVA